MPSPNKRCNIKSIRVWTNFFRMGWSKMLLGSGNVWSTKDWHRQRFFAVWGVPWKCKNGNHYRAQGNLSNWFSLYPWLSLEFTWRKPVQQAMSVCLEIKQKICQTLNLIIHTVKNGVLHGKFISESSGAWKNFVPGHRVGRRREVVGLQCVSFADQKLECGNLYSSTKQVKRTSGV